MIFVLICFNSVYAHLDAGQDKAANGYLIDLGYTPAELISMEKASFALNLVNDTTKDPIGIDKVWIRISGSKDTVFAGNFYPEFESVAFTFTFPYPDTYEMSTKFFVGDALAAEANFNILVNGGKTSKWNISLLLGILLISMFAFARFILKKKK